MTKRKSPESGVYEKGVITMEEIFAKTLSSLPSDAGALFTFTGVTKIQGTEGKEVSKLEMETYEEVANDTIRRICEEVKDKYGVSFVRIYHLVGEFDVSEPIVFVAVASRNRGEAYPALKEAIERYKSEPALWKKEVYTDGTHSWISHA